MNEFRNKVLGGSPPRGSLLRSKAPKAEPSRAAEDESFSELAIPRTAGRSVNHRDDDRHRLSSELATLCFSGDRQQVTLINLSGGGAMIEGAAGLALWDKIELELGGEHRLEAIVRWIKGDRFGLEFAHETRIEAGSEELAETLRAVIQRSFSDVAMAVAAEAVAVPREPDRPSDEPARQPEQAEAEQRELRHPLIWSGLVHYNHDSTPVRLRNISAGGAMIEGSNAFPVGADVLLDLGDAGTLFGTVHWARGDQAGLKFHAPYDVSRLANARPEVAGPRWIAPDYLRDDRSSSSPWASQWGRSDLAGLHRSLSGRRNPLRRA